MKMHKSGWMRAYLLALALACALVAGCGAPGAQPIPLTAPLWEVLPTRTPFLPVTSTPKATPTPMASPTPVASPTMRLTDTPSVPPSATPTVAPLDGMWRGINFEDGSQRIAVSIWSAELPAQVDFRPGYPCAYINRTACVGLYADSTARALLVTVHSGVGGDGQGLRHALEGTGWNSAGLPLPQIAANLVLLRGAPVQAQQGDSLAQDLRVIAALRVPPEGIPGYMNRTITETLADFAQTDGDLANALAASITDPLLVIETCGWRHMDEVVSWLANDTTGSIYLLVIGR